MRKAKRTEHPAVMCSGRASRWNADRPEPPGPRRFFPVQIAARGCTAACTRAPCAAAEIPPGTSLAGRACMLDPAQAFRRRPAASLVAAVLPPFVAAGTAGCCRTNTSTEEIAWPESAPCPPADEAALYMEGFSQPDGCGTSLVSVDGEGERTDG